MSSNNKDQTSTLQSYVDSAKGAVQSAVGSLTGNPVDKREAEDKRAVADAEHDLSKSAAKAGPFTVSPSGGVAKDSHDRTAGSWNQTVGAGKEAIGGLVGAEGLRQEGIQQNQEGKGQEAEGQVKDFGRGVADRVGGNVGAAVSSLTGNDAQRREAERQHDEGKARQRGVEKDLQKEADRA
ncbi:hypothetical protein M011DRAFT_515517 [Sporormia fimetaria CBS 119925]|uniref:CsbD-like domain-containing protein n=1 Tax=Sporormia fimetaria CBS 119925 TaxID=1340428 RepID=A0A6A6VEA6_9PLEO|nr:hypothetical protein M011DRAFT_515517 [Sporormia fimetaria CBS 119925]